MPTASVASFSDRPFRKKRDRDHFLEILPPVADISDTIGPSRVSAVFEPRLRALEYAAVCPS